MELNEMFTLEKENNIELVLKRAIIRELAQDVTMISEQVLPLLKLKTASELYQLIASLDPISALILCLIRGKDFRAEWRRAAHSKSKRSETKIARETWDHIVEQLFPYIM